MDLTSGCWWLLVAGVVTVSFGFKSKKSLWELSCKLLGVNYGGHNGQQSHTRHRAQPSSGDGTWRTFFICLIVTLLPGRCTEPVEISRNFTWRRGSVTLTSLPSEIRSREEMMIDAWICWRLLAICLIAAEEKELSAKMLSFHLQLWKCFIFIALQMGIKIKREFPVKLYLRNVNQPGIWGLINFHFAPTICCTLLGTITILLEYILGEIFELSCLSAETRTSIHSYSYLISI